MANNDKFWYLENFNLFKTVGMGRLKALEELTCMINCDRNKEFIFDGDLTQNVFFLKEGKVKIVAYNNDGTEYIKSILKPGEIFGKIPYLPDSGKNEYAKTLSDTVLCYMPADKFKELMQSDFELHTQVLKFVGLRLKKLERKVHSLSFKDSKHRIVDLLIDFANDYGRKIGEEYFIEQPLSHKDIASLTANSRQTVTKILNELRKENLIDFNRRKLIVRNLKALKSLSPL